MDQVQTLAPLCRICPPGSFLDEETPLPGGGEPLLLAACSVWQFPDYENGDTFVNQLVRRGVLAHDPVVHAVLQGQPQAMAPRTLRHRFVRATGLTHSHIRQVERARRAAALLRQGRSIADTVYEAGYFDQPHLTRSLKQWVGQTPAKLTLDSAVLYKTAPFAQGMMPMFCTNALRQGARTMGKVICWVHHVA